MGWNAVIWKEPGRHAAHAATVVDGAVQDDGLDPVARRALEYRLAHPIRVAYLSDKYDGDHSKLYEPGDPGHQRAVLESMPNAYVEGDD